MLYPVSYPKPDSPDDRIGYIDSTGRLIVPPTYEAGGYFSEGLAAVVREDGSSGFIDASGEVRIPFGFAGIGRFQEGLCSIGSGPKVGYIRRDGTWQIPPQFAIASSFHEAFAIVSFDGSAFGYINRAGAFLARPQFEQARPFSQGFGAVCRDEKWGYLAQLDPCASHSSLTRRASSRMAARE